MVQTLQVNTYPMWLQQAIGLWDAMYLMKLEPPKSKISALLKEACGNLFVPSIM